ncbi:hypothetical protein BL250_02385 [Erwinia sp. OLTSP20]|nr:hypothetical protein BV501_16155 [Erwinia sp. OAMSP11]PIJ69431.1 hypothetical protein BK416_15100 [Erwinia sp. OLSSP12]PIJ79265.1 hypothetical protein BLD47_15405 [Erwinia sp. OLCASP19]PIJ80791.1 hypothetical protein BLD46_14565 [Erwinia sp. OLMTSP26]PIJ82943.1 hypothetical protein BLD49_14460 [Erwinia sp. OLMDSP33]PIJ91795.1 hypothetical protein BL249_08270 [Erwinia sp. OLFS4]PIJ94629.1 hypothetical protein BL250_02385 [Erwinia sp. OLTSP20]
MKLSCRRCGSSRLVFLRDQQRGYIHSAVCACCQKPLTAGDWNLLPQMASENLQISSPEQDDNVYRAALSEIKSEQ